MKGLDLGGGARELSNTGRRVVMWLLILVTIALFLNAAYSDGVAWVLAWTFGVPLMLVAMSLAFGKASKGNGLFGSKTLYVIGSIIAFALLYMAALGDELEDTTRVLGASWVPAVIFILAHKRRIKERGGWT